MCSAAGAGAGKRAAQVERRYVGGLHAAFTSTDPLFAVAFDTGEIWSLRVDAGATKFCDDRLIADAFLVDAFAELFRVRQRLRGMYSAC